ncbi:MAG: hypothetical protein ACK5NT_13635 [Pyrinomonadaceae bacterium]
MKMTMFTKIGFTAFFFVISLGFAFAQDTVAPSEVTDSPETAEDTAKKTGDDSKSDAKYQTKLSLEVGGRFRDVSGSEEKYRSDLNYKSAVTVFDSSLYVENTDSKPGDPFDSLLLTASGWGADPTGSVRLNMEKLEWYQFNAAVRQINYYNYLVGFADNEHNRDTTRNFGDFDVTFLPTNEKAKFRFGYSFNKNSGAGGLTYDYQRDEFPLESEIDSSANDLRFGADSKLAGFNLSYTLGIRKFNDKTRYAVITPQLGGNPSPNSSLNSLDRLIPENGSVTYHQGSVHRSFGKWVDLTGRFIYSESDSQFSIIESITGKDASGNTIVGDQLTGTGGAKRPNGNGDVGVVFYVNDNFRITNTFNVNSYRVTGTNTLYDSLMRKTAAGVPMPTSYTSNGIYRFTNFRRIMDTIIGDFDVSRYLSVYGGYRYTNRRVILNKLDTNLISNAQSANNEEFENTTNSVLAGVKAKPFAKRWTIWFDLEHGEADNVFTRLANYSATNVRIKNQITPIDNLNFNVDYQHKDNTNPAANSSSTSSDYSAEVKSRIFSGTFDWMPKDYFSVSGGYTYNHTKSDIAVIFPINRVMGAGWSRYELKSSFYNLNAWVQPINRLSLFGGYRIVKDAGDGYYFSADQRLIESSYPISFQSPEVRATIKLSRNLDWNMGYQYYKYTETVLPQQNYKAHLPYISVRLYLGGVDR